VTDGRKKQGKRYPLPLLLTLLMLAGKTGGRNDGEGDRGLDQRTPRVARRAIALVLGDWLHIPNVASQMRHFCAHPVDALQLLYGKLLR